MTLPGRLRLILGLFDRRMRVESIVLFGLMLVNAAMESVGVSTFLPLLEALSGVDGVASRAVTDLAAAMGITDRRDQMIALLAGAAAVFVIKAAVSLLMARYQYRFIWRHRTRLAANLMRVYLSAPYESTLTRSGSGMLRNVTSSVIEVMNVSILALSQLLSEIAVTVALLALLLAFAPGATLVSAAILGVTMLVYLRLVRRRMHALGQAGYRTSETILAVATGNLGALREIKLAAREDWFARRFHDAVAEHSDVQWRYGVLTTLPRQILELVLVLSLAGTVGWFLATGRDLAAILPTLGLFAAAAFRMMPSMNRIATNIGSLRFGTTTLEQLTADLSLPPCPRREGGAIPAGWRRLALDGIGYGYPGGRQIMSGVSLEIGRGQAVALVGPSGSGKTTLANIIAGLLPAGTGTITLDGAPVEPGSRAWQARIGYVPQDVVLLDDTLAANIAFGEAPEAVDAGRLARAVALAQLEPLVAELPQGLATRVGERGKGLSGGQRQRVGIARALYRDAEMLILDEATSALDAETEAAVTESIHALKGRYTMVIIAHRLSTVRDCDSLVLMVDGKVAETGTFAELNQRSEQFARMVRHMDLSSALEGDEPCP